MDLFEIVPQKEGWDDFGGYDLNHLGIGGKMIDFGIIS